ncbi:MAG: AmmeMemoRadiSam system protein A [Acidobacteriota bacterium]
MSSAKEEVYTPPLLARKAVENYLRSHIVIDSPMPLPTGLYTRAATFVSIKTDQGQLRGCIGTIQPLYDNVAEEIIRNAIKAATEDYRFPPVREIELECLVYSVDILTPLESIDNLSEHDPLIYGLMIETLTGRRGVLLPDLEGIKTAEAQLAALRHKIGLAADIPVKMSRFRVERFGKK